MDDTNTTHPNAYRAEADEKRRQAALLAAEANQLEAQARELEGSVTEEPPVTEEPTNTDQEQEKKKGFLKK